MNLSIVLAGFFGGIANTVAGGGSLVTLPALLDAGLPPDVANGTNRPFVVAQSIAAVWAMAAANDADVETTTRALAPAVAFGATVGAVASLWMPSSWFEPALGVVLLMLGAVIVADPMRAVPSPPPPPANARVQVITGFGVAAYGGWLQAGVGIPLTLMLGILSGLSPRATSAAKSALTVVINTPALLVFLLNDKIAAQPSANLAFGGIFGAILGARVVERGGAPIIRAALVVTAFVNGARLLLT